MDQTLNNKIIAYEKALLSLKNVLDTNFTDKIILRDATIKRFEYCFDICYKLIKVFLKEKFGIIENYPKTAFRALKEISEFNEKFCK